MPDQIWLSTLGQNSCFDFSVHSRKWFCQTFTSPCVHTWLVLSWLLLGLTNDNHADHLKIECQTHLLHFRKAADKRQDKVQLLCCSKKRTEDFILCSLLCLSVFLNSASSMTLRLHVGFSNYVTLKTRSTIYSWY